MTRPENHFPDCERCDDTELDPDAYITHETANGTAYRNAPCSNCQPQREEGDDAKTATGGIPSGN